MRCTVKSCKNKFFGTCKNKKSFFWCPKDELLKQKWIAFVGSSVSLSGNWKVCEDRFNKEDIAGQLQCDLAIQRKLQLRVGAVPTIVSRSADENLSSVYADDNNNGMGIEFCDVVEYHDMNECNEGNLIAAKGRYEDDVAADNLKQIQKLKSELSALQQKYEQLEATVHSNEWNFKDSADIDCNEPSYTWVDQLTEGGLTKPSTEMMAKMHDLEKIFRQFNGDELLVTRNFLKQHLDAADSVNCSNKVKKLFFRARMYFNIRKCTKF